MPALLLSSVIIKILFLIFNLCVSNCMPSCVMWLFPRNLCFISGVVFIHQVSSRNHGINKYNFKYRENANISLTIWQEFLSSSWQYWSTLPALPSASLFCWGLFRI